MAFRREALERIGGFDENLGPGTVFKVGEASMQLRRQSGMISRANTIPRRQFIIITAENRKEKSGLLLAGYAQGTGAS